MVKKYIMEMYEEAVKEAVKNMSEILEGRRFRRRKDDTGYSEDEIHKRALKLLLVDADKKTTLEIIQGIAEGKFADGQHSREDVNELRDIVRDNIHDDDIVNASFGAMKNMLNHATDYIKRRKERKAVAEVNKMQDMLSAISDLYDEYPNKLGKYTDDVYEVYKNMMKEYVLHDFHSDTTDDKRISDYYYGSDAYKDNKESIKEVTDYYQQVDAAWETKEHIEAAKQRMYNKLTKKQTQVQIADYEQSHAEQVKKEDAKYVEDLKKFVKERDNPELRKKRDVEMEASWNSKEILDNIKKDSRKDITDEEIAEWEKNLQEHLKEADAKYVEDLKKFVKERLEAAQKAEKEHRNKMLNEAHKDKAEWTLKRRVYGNDVALEDAYKNFKDVAREPTEGEKAKEVPLNNDVPERAVFIARVEGKRRA